MEPKTSPKSINTRVAHILKNQCIPDIYTVYSNVITILMCVKQICIKIRLGYGSRALFVFFRQMVDVSDIQEIGYHQRAFLGATIDLC